MSIHDPRDTLAYFSSRPLCEQRDMGQTPCKLVASAIWKMMETPGFVLAKPEESALWFYFLNHGKSIIAQKYHPLEPLSPADREFVDKYHRFSISAAIRAFYYLLLICIRESRHAHGYDLQRGVEDNFGPEAWSFNKKIEHKGSVGSYQTFLTDTPKMTISTLCRSLQYMFYNGVFSPGFGGRAWGAIADCLVSFVDGTYSPEVMLDVVWTLCHNNGAIFNKGMFYESYTNTLYRILDIQRSGEIIEACLSDKDCQAYAGLNLGSMICDFMDRYPGEFGTYVNWFVVEAHGALHGPYNHEKNHQIKKYGLDEASIAMMDKKAKAAAQDALDKAEKAANFAKTHFEYWPGVHCVIKSAPKGRVTA